MKNWPISFRIIAAAAGLAIMAIPTASLAQANVAADKKNQKIAELLSEIHETDQAEIDAGNLAKEKATGDGVRAFAQQLVTDHTDADQKVVALAQKIGVELSPPAPLTPKEQENAKHNEELKQKLQSDSKEKFDADFLAAMEKGHREAIAMVKHARETIRNDEVRKTLDELLPTLEEHKKMAEQLSKK
jgi:putative membrane protein